jgi:hypothetical protein
LDKQGYLDSRWQTKINGLLENIGFQKKANTFILRLGRHSGAEAMTLNGVRSIKIMQGQGNPSKSEKESKTVWLAAPDKDARTGLLPFGWVLVEMDSEKDESWTGSESNTNELKSWQTKTAAKVARLRAEHEKQIAARRAAEENERLEDLDKAKRQQALEEKLQALTPLARELETQIERKKWERDKDAFWKPGGIESWLKKLETESDRPALERLAGLFDRHFPGALKDPDKTEGKKNKPAFKDRVRQVAKALNALRAK